MAAPLIQLDTHRHQSRVLMEWLASDPERGARAAVQPLPQVANTTAFVTSSDRAGMLSLLQPVLSSSGVPVTERTAMQVSTVYSCLSRIAAAIVQLPIHEYQLGAGGARDQIEPTPIWWMLNESPSDLWTAAAWKEWIVRCVGLRGDQHTEILRAGPRVIGFKPHHPDYCQARLVNGRLRYDVQDFETGKFYGVDQDDMLHFTGFGFDGVRSLSVISYAARQAIGNSLAAADYAGRMLGENAMPQVALKYPQKLNEEQRKVVRESWVATYGGPGNRKFPLVLPEGADVKELSISPVDLELIALRKFDKLQICEAFGVPPIILGDAEKTSAWGTGIEQVMLGFTRFTIAQHLARWTEELNRKLYRRAGRFLEFDLDALLEGDAKAQAEYFRAALGGPGTGDGWMSKNEVRRKKNLKPVDGGEKLYVAQAGTPAARPAPGAAPADPPPKA